jgi:hypothetical protein
VALQSSISKPAWKRFVPIAIVSAAFAHNLWISWLKWGDVLVDCGREMDVARQLAEGRALYSDLRYMYGPLAPWTNAALFKLFGVHTAVLMTAGILSAALACWILYRLSRRFVSRLAATCITTSFLYICAFAQLTPLGIFNFAFPYTYAAPYGIVMLATGLLFLVRYVQRAKTSDLIWSLLFLFLTSLTKMELLAALLSAHAVSVFGLLLARRLNLRLTIPAYAVALLAVAIFYGALWFRVGSELLTDNLLAMLNPTNRRYTQMNMGLLDWTGSLQAMLYSALALIAAIAVPAFFCAFSPLKGIPWILNAAIFGAGAAIYFLLSLEYPFRILPLLAFGSLIVLMLRLRAPQADPARVVSEAALWITVAVCCSRALLRMTSFHFGFYLVVPGLVALGVFWFEYVPQIIPQRLAFTRKSASFLGCGVFAGLIAAHFQYSSFAFAQRTIPISTPYARLDIADRIAGVHAGLCCSEAVRLLGELPPSARVLAVPQGVGLLSCAGLRNPYGSSGFFLQEMTGRYDDAHLLAHLKTQPPDVVMLTAVGSDEYPEIFGRDYAVLSWAWIRENYEPAVSLGPSNFILIFKRKDAPFPFPSVPPERRAQ